MAIASHVKEQGVGHVVVRSYDQDGKEYMFSFYTDGIVDVDALIAAKVAALSADLARVEFERIVGSV